MWKRVCHFFRRHAASEDPLIEFEEGLLLIVDAEQLANNLRSKLQQSLGAEDTIIYLADVGGAVRGFSPVGEPGPEIQERGSGGRTFAPLPAIATDSKTAGWFRANRETLLLSNRDTTLEYPHEELGPLVTYRSAVLEYLHDELGPFVAYGMDLVLPLISMERLIGLVFVRFGQTVLSEPQLRSLQLLSRQAGLAFGNALLFKERLRQNERMYRAEQLATMGQFAAGVAHELRNPLTAIRSTIQFLAGEFADGSEQQKLSQITLEEVDRVNGIVGNLLSLAQPTESRPVVLDPAQEVGKCLTFVEARARSQNVELQVVSDEQVPKVVIDPMELRQVLLNSIVNGLQAMPTGGVLCIRVLRLPSPAWGPGSEDVSRAFGRGALIEVADQGPGIPRELRERVFEPFFTTKAGGTGLGLAICRSIVKRYDGEIWVEEAEGGGTSVKVLLRAE
jgi:signal transduction histidine kinase